MLSVSGGVVLPQVGRHRRGQITSDRPTEAVNAGLFAFFRECQVKHWPKHKKSCQLLVEASEKIKKGLCIECRGEEQ